MVRSCFFVACLASLSGVSTGFARTMHTMHRREAPPSGYVRSHTAPGDHVLDLRLALAQNDFPGLEERLLAASTPGHQQYGQYLSKDEVSALVAPLSDTVSAVREWLASHNITSTPLSPSGDIRTASVTVKQANELLGAEYSVFTEQKTGAQTIRTLSYSIPEELRGHVNTIYPTTQFPPAKRSKSSAVISRARFPARDIPDSCTHSFTPECAIELYNIPSNLPAQSKVTLGVAGLKNYSVGYNDLQIFLQKYRPEVSDTTSFTIQGFDGYVNDQSTIIATEPNLDTQYTVGLVSPTVPVAFYGVGTDTSNSVIDEMIVLGNALLQQENLPSVLSVSYGLVEGLTDQATTATVCNLYAQLGARGVSVLVSAGDFGLEGGEDPTRCKEFQVDFPASCPYVTAVGGTMGINPEIAWDQDSSGFSSWFPSPSYQQSQVQAYLKTLPAGYDVGRFNVSGRGYPDISSRGAFTEIIVNGEVAITNGTSISAPIAASIFALLNAELVAAGKSPLGFLNPFIYAHPEAFTDITEGANPSCNSQGFNATTGWDALTGFGTPNYPKLRTAAGLQ
ncbi:family S53 protease-like protein [Dentipellis sp. KUC8613]|nr:family S53 protease-like protein [Dentipellis sp. KUC8613]